MKPIIQKVSFYPFSYSQLPRKGFYAIMRYNTVLHKWVIIGKQYGMEIDIIRYVRELNEDAGLITEDFIVGYEE